MLKSRDRLVDNLRGISILLVLLLHFHLTYHLNRGFFALFLPSPILSNIFNNGNYGVVIFFVISGFLITSTTLKRFGKLESVKLRDFYTFRLGRVAPNIALMLALVTLFAIVGIRIFQNDGAVPSFGLTVLSVITFTHNLLMEKYGYFNYCLNILWSLSVEEVFYLTFPVVCILVRKTWAIAFVWALFLAISPLYRFLHRNDATDIYGLYDYLSCFDGLAIGCLVALAKQHYTMPAWANHLGLPAAALIALIYYQGIWTHVVLGISAVSFLTGVILLGAGNKSETSITPIAVLGKYSYELYLFHIVILAFMKMSITEKDLGLYQKPLLLVAFLALSTLTAVLISRFYSEPLNSRIRKSFRTNT